MGFPQTASGVTAGIQTQYGTTTVENAAQGIFAQGVLPVQFGLHLVAGQPKLAFDFVALGDPTLALHFTFGGARVLRPVGWSSFRSGLADVEKPLDAAPKGWVSTRFGLHVVSDRPKLGFDFVDLGNPSLALQFNFGPPQMVTSGGGLDSLVFGRTEIEGLISAAPVGWESLRFGNTVVSDQPKLVFDFIDLGDPTLALHFNFGGAYVLVSQGRDSSEFGVSLVENGAQGIFARGIPPAGFGLHVVASQPKLLFDFVALGNPSLPIQFYFGDANTRQFQPLGWDSLEVSPWTLIWTRPWFDVFPVGLNATQWGNTKVSPLIIYMQGLYSFQAGNNVPRRDGELQGLGFESFEPGTPLAYVQLLPIQMQGFDSFRSDRHRLLSGGLNTGVVAADCTDLTFAIDEEDERRHFRWVSFSQHDNMFYRGTPEPDRAIVEKSADGLTWQYVSSLRSYAGSAETYKRTAVQRPVIGNGVAANTLYYLSDRDRGAVRFGALTDAAFAEYYAAGQTTGWKTGQDIGDDEYDGGIIFNPDDEYFYYVPRGSVNYSSFSQRQRRTRNGLVLESLPRNGVHHDYSPFGYYSYPHAYHIFYKGIVYSSSVDSPSRLVLPPVAYRFEDGIMVRFKPEIPDHEFNWWTVAVDHKNDLLYAITSQGTHYPGIYNRYFWRFDGTTWTHLNTQELWDSPPTSNGIQQLEVVDGAAILLSRNSQYCLDFIDRYQEISDGFLPPPPHSTLVAMTLSYPGIARWPSFLSLEVYYPNPQVDGAFFRRQFLRGEMPYSPILFASDGETLIGTAHSQVYPTTCGFVGEGTPLTAPYNTTFLYDFGCLEWFSEMRRFPQFIDATGIEPHQFGDSDHPDDTWISNWWREITLPFWDLQDAYGEPFVAFRIRYLDVFQGIRSLEMGEFQVGFHQDVDMIGRDHLVFGEHEIMVRQIYSTGWDSLEFGPDYSLRVSFGQQYALMRGFRMPEFGEFDVWNRTQFINFRPLCPEPTLPHWCDTEWGQKHFFFVRNRNRHIYPHGTVMTRFAFRVALVLNTGRAVWVKSLEKDNFGPWYERHQVAFYIRYFPLVGWDSFRMVTFHRIHNAARALYPIGFDATQFGTGLRHILWRWLLQNGSRMDEHGVPWVSRSPREIGPRSPRWFLHVGVPFIDFGQRYIAPEGIRSNTHAFVGPYLTQKPIPTITPRWIWDEYRMGLPSIKNVTPQLFVVGRSMFDSNPRAHWVSHSPRYPSPQGWQMARYGRPDVNFRDRTIFMWPHVSSRVTQHLRVENVNPSPVLPTQQTVFMSDWCRGTSQNRCALMGSLTVHTNVLFPVGNSFMALGTPSLLHNAIWFRAHHQPNTLGWTEWGMPSVNRPQTIYLGKFFRESSGSEAGEHYGRAPTSTPPKVRVSPHTIWARLDTPQQAKDNHPESEDFCEVDRFCRSGTHPFGPSADGTGPWFGSINVRPDPGIDSLNEIKCASNFNPNSEVSRRCHRMFMRLGEPKVENRNRRMLVDGWVSIRFGFPRVMTPTNRNVTVWGSANTGAKFGEPWIGNKNRELFVGSVSPVQFGATQIENFNRFVYVSGLNATQWGNNNPMVHFPRTLTPYDNILTQWGTTWVSHSPRWVFVEGTDMFQSWWTELATRMIVRRMRHVIRGYNFSIMTEWGDAHVHQNAPVISPYGIAAPCVNPHVTVEHG